MKIKSKEENEDIDVIMNNCWISAILFKKGKKKQKVSNLFLFLLLITKWNYEIDDLFKRKWKKIK